MKYCSTSTVLMENMEVRSGLPITQQALAQKLLELGQEHLFADWSSAETQEAEKNDFMAKLETLDKNYPGGIAAYISTARRLLGQSQRGENPLEGWTPSVPNEGFDLDPGTPDFSSAEQRGLMEVGTMGFVVPAGGLGERLGFSGVKFALPSDTCSGATVLQVYIGYILAAQRLAARRLGREVSLPLAIMVSADTEAGITELLEKNDYYGMTAAQVTLLKQEKVAALSDTSARIAVAAPFKVKPRAEGSACSCVAIGMASGEPIVPRDQ